MTARYIQKTLRQARKLQELTLPELAHRTGYGVRTIQTWELTIPRSLRVLEDWAEALGYDITVVRKQE